VLFADWDLGDPPLQGEVTGIHHPVGSYKRISFGERAVDATYLVEGDLAPGNLFHQVYWKKGRVEHGSSGSPLFSAPGVLIGQLSYSIFSQQLSACKIDPSFAGYGRFSNVYQHARDYFENLPAATVVAENPDVRFSALNGVVAPVSRTVRLTTKSPGEIPFKLRADQPWIKLSTISGTASAAAPATIEISTDPSKFDRADQFQSTVTILAGAAGPQFINVYADVKADRSSVTATVTPNPVTGRLATPRYSFTVRLQETAGFATTVTGVKLNGYEFNLLDWFGSDRIGAKGSLEAQLSTDFPFAPGLQFFEFWGVDEATGRTWYTTATATF